MKLHCKQCDKTLQNKNKEGSLYICPECGCEDTYEIKPQHTQTQEKDDIITPEQSKKKAIDILYEAISRLKGREPLDFWKGQRGINYDAVALAIKTVERV